MVIYCTGPGVCHSNGQYITASFWLWT